MKKNKENTSENVVVVSPEMVDAQSPEKIFISTTNHTTKVVKATTSFILSGISILAAVFMYMFISASLVSATSAFAALILIAIISLLLLAADVFAVISNLLSLSLFLSAKKTKSILLAYIFNCAGLILNILVTIYFISALTAVI